MNSSPVGLSYNDGSDTVLIAVLTNSIGQLVGSNQVIYTNAFVGLDADLLYTYTKAGLEQDVVLREQPPTPGSLNLSPETTCLQVLTEFFNPPQPAQMTSALPAQSGLALTDDTLDFGTMQMIPGKAFMLGEDSPSARVGKSWVTLQGRQFLVEAVPVAALAEQLDALPAPATQTASITKTRMISRNLVLPPQHLAKAVVQPLKLARTGINRKPGVVLDYLTVNSSLTNYTFQGDTTYYISGKNYIYGTNTFEGGAVLKYATNSSINSASGSGALRNPTIIWQGSAYRPVIFTAIDDNTVGTEISGSTGSPSGYYANPALGMAVGNTANLSGFRIAYAQEALVLVEASSGSTFENGQIVNCACGFNDSINSATLENVLFENVQTDFFNLNYATINVENSTFSSNSYLTTASSGISYQTLVPNFTNCIFADVVNLTNSISGTDLIYGVNGSDNGFYNSPFFGSDMIPSPSYPFQTAGGGEYYLANGCNFHNAGTANIDPVLLANLATKTTYPPIAFTNVTFSSATTFPPQAQRDNTGTPDLGYHYDPIDYSFGGCFADANLTFTAGTAVGWFRTSSGWEHAGYGIDMGAGVTVFFSGTATAPDYWVRLNTVQEQDYTAGYGQAGIETWVNSDLPTVSGQFLRCSEMANELRSYFSDDGGAVQAYMVNSEFWGGSLCAYGDYMYFTNCLMQRVDMELWNGSAGTARIAWDCTFFGGGLVIDRVNGGPTLVSMRNSSFDGTSISTSDYYGSNPTYSDYDYNAYTNSVDPFSVGGASDVPGATFNWQSGWFGNFYLPTGSHLIDVGSAPANELGLFDFTTQTSSIPETNSIVDIGYHYPAMDQFITGPNNATVTYGNNATFSVVVADASAPVSYQWQKIVGGVSQNVGGNSASYTEINPSVAETGTKYDVIVSSGGSSVTSSQATLTVNPAALTVTPTSGQFMSYGQNVPTLTYAITGFQNGDNQSVVSGAPVLSTTATSSSQTGTYPITVTLGSLSAANYTFVPANGVLLKVNPAALNITAVPQSKTYGGTLTFGSGSTKFTSSGLQNDDTVGTVTLTCGGGVAAAGAGNYSIIPSALTGGSFSAANYTITYIAGSLAVNPVALTVAPTSGQFMSYGQNVPTLTYAITGFQNGDNQSVVSGAPVLSTTATSSSQTGTYPITVTLGSLSAANYTFVPANGVLLKVNPAALNITAVPQSKTYGGTLTFGSGSTKFTSSGLQNDDTVGTVTLTCSGGVAAAGAGNYSIIPSALTGGSFSAANYTITYIAGSLTVNQAALTVTATNQTMGYGQSVPTLTYVITGFLNGDSPTVVSGAPALSTTGGSSSPTGTYPIIVAQGSLSAANYTFVLANGTLTIESVVSLSVSPSQASASEVAGSSATVTVSRTDTGAALTVNYTSAPGSTAVAGTDYQTLSGSVTILGGSQTASVLITPVANANTGVGTKTVTLALASGSYVPGTTPSPACTIFDQYANTDGDGLADAMAASFGCSPLTTTTGWDTEDSSDDGLPATYEALVGSMDIPAPTLPSYSLNPVE